VTLRSYGSISYGGLLSYIYADLPRTDPRVRAVFDWLRTDLAWRELRLETAKARLEMVVCERELLRAQTIDHSLPGNDHYDTAPLRGQFSRAQQRWHAVASNARQARIAFERAGTTLASSKEAYAQLMRNGPAQLPVPPRAEPDERPTRLDLSGWAITRGDISRRRGLRHALDNAAYPPPQLRKSAYKLSPTPRTPLPATAAMPPTAPRPGVQVPRAKPTTADSMKPWDLVEPTARTAAAKPAPRAVAPAPVTAPAVAPATAAVKPPAEAPITAAKPVAQPRAKPQSVPGKAIRTRKPSAPPTTRMIGPELPPGGLTTTKAPRTFGPELPPGGLTKKPPQR